MIPDIKLPRPHSKGQEEFLTWKGSIACFAGRRWGKTLICGIRLLECGFNDPGLYWWVGLSWKAASMKRAWRTLKMWHKQIWTALGQDASKYINKTDREMTFPDGFIIWFRTAENPESLQGEGVKGIIIDEIGFMNRDVWETYIEPCTIDFGAWVVMISQANGTNWYDEFWESIKRGDRKDWIAREYTTFDNPILMNNPKSKEKLDEILANTPAEIVATQYWAKRLSTTNKAFDPKAVKDCRMAGRTQLPFEKGKYYVAFVDGSGGGQNAYCLSIMHKENREGQDVYIQDVIKAHNFAKTKPTTKEFAQICKSYGIYRVIGDKYSGQWIVEEFLSNGIAYEQSEENKSELFKDSVIAINQRRVEYLDRVETELQLIAIEYKSVGDHFKFEKPKNSNDDHANVLSGNIKQLSGIKVSMTDVKVAKNTESERFHGSVDTAADVISAIM